MISGEPFELDIHYEQADHPVDLYYLMEMPFSMHDDKELLANLANELTGAMRNLTTDFRVGFGSFVDKDIVPFVMPRDIKTKELVVPIDFGIEIGYIRFQFQSKFCKILPVSFMCASVFVQKSHEVDP